MIVIEPTQLACLLKISREDAMMFTLFLGGRSSQEIAEAAGVPRKKVRATIARAISRLGWKKR